MASSTESPKKRASKRKVQARGSPGTGENVVQATAASSAKTKRTSQRAAQALTAAPRPDVQAPQENSIRPLRARIVTPPEPTPAPKLTDRSEPASANDSTAIPGHVADRFVQVGRKFYFPNGEQAFRDRGVRLTTPSENTEVIRSLLDIAQARGWERIRVTGSERFRKEAWQQAKLSGLSVRGYGPSAVEQAQLVRLIDRERNKDREPGGSRATEDPQAAAHRSAEVAPERHLDAQARNPKPTAVDRVIRGRLVDYGAANYQFDSKADRSFYVKIDTGTAERTVWGKDLERAIMESLSKVKKGDEVSVRALGEKPVTVQRASRDPNGKVTGQVAVAAYRNRWLVESREFLDQRAEVARIVRDPSIDPKTAGRQRPELIGTYLELRAAELVAKEVYRDPQDQHRFVRRVREALADEIERGEPLSAVRVRDDQRREPPQAPGRGHPRVLS